MIDWDRVQELRDEIGEEDFEEIATVFLEECDEAVANLAQNMSASELENALHFLKGSALNLGFCDLATLSADGEKAASHGECERINIAMIKDSYHTSKSLFSQKTH